MYDILEVFTVRRYDMLHRDVQALDLLSLGIALQDFELDARTHRERGVSEQATQPATQTAASMGRITLCQRRVQIEFVR